MKILGIGNAIVDVICKVENSFLDNNGLTCKICTACYPNRKNPIKIKKA